MDFITCQSSDILYYHGDPCDIFMQQEFNNFNRVLSHTQMCPWDPDHSIQYNKYAARRAKLSCTRAIFHDTCAVHASQFFFSLFVGGLGWEVPVKSRGKQMQSWDKFLRHAENCVIMSICFICRPDSAQILKKYIQHHICTIKHIQEQLGKSQL